MAPQMEENDLVIELEAGMANADVDIGITFTAQLDAWFALRYQMESIRVQYQRMVAMGNRSEKEPNLKPVIAQFGSIKEEMDILESLMIKLLDAEKPPESAVNILNASHYYPSKGIGYAVPEGLKRRLQAAWKNTPNNGKVISDNNP